MEAILLHRVMTETDYDLDIEVQAGRAILTLKLDGKLIYKTHGESHSVCFSNMFIDLMDFYNENKIQLKLVK